jgi:hypothetical protein
MKILKLSLFLLWLPLLSAAAQNLDSLYNSFLEMHSYSGKFKNLPQLKKTADSDASNKCGFSLVSDVKNYFDQFTPEQQKIMQPMFSRLILTNSMVTPGGYFKIHYDSSGVNKPGYDLNLLAAALDSTYNFEITKLGYPVPPSDGIEGGDDKYDIYIINIPYYGATIPETSVTGLTSTSYIHIDNDFIGRSFATHGIEAARATVAHEFHHAIQIGGYRDSPQGSDRFYYELTATAFEEFVFDEVNDYYAYLHTYFTNPARTFGRFNGGNDGYDLAIWNIFLQKKYGFNVLKRTWDFMVDQRALRAIENALVEEGTSLKREFNEFGEWMHFTGPRKSITFPYFEEGENYPLIKPLLKVLYLPPSDANNISSFAMSNNYIQYVDETQGRSDTLIAVVTNADITGGYDADDPAITSFTFELSSVNSGGEIKVTDNYFFNTSLTSSNSRLFLQKNILNNIPNEPILVVRQLDYPYPQPYVTTQYPRVNIPVSTNNNSPEAELVIFSVSMNLIYSAKLNVDSISDEPKVTWDGKDNNGDAVSAGIYVYVTKRESEIMKGKIAVFND